MTTQIEVPALSVALTRHTPERAERTRLDVFASEANYLAGVRMAMGLSKSSLVPEAYRDQPHNVLIALEVADRIGCSVFMVMQNLDIIHGRPGWRATFLIATVNASGRFTPLRFRMTGTRGTDSWGCVAVATDKASGELCEGAEITMELAKAEGWYHRKGSKWVTMPEQMMRYRAAAFWTRTYCPELALGMGTSEEVVDVEGVDTTHVSPKASAIEERLRGAAPAVPAPAPPKSEPKPATPAAPKASELEQKLAASVVQAQARKSEPPPSPDPAASTSAVDWQDQLETMRATIAEGLETSTRPVVRSYAQAALRDAPPEIRDTVARYWSMMTGEAL